MGKLAQKYWNYYLKGTGSIPHSLYYFCLIFINMQIPSEKIYIKLVKEEIEIWIKMMWDYERNFENICWIL